MLCLNIRFGGRPEVDGNDSVVGSREAETQLRILNRRAEAVGVPLSDRIHEGAPSIGEDLIARLNEAQPPR